MIPLSSKGVFAGTGAPLVAKVFRGDCDAGEWSPYVRVVTTESELAKDPAAAGWLCEGLVRETPRGLVVSQIKCGHLADGDVVAISPNGSVRTLYRRGSPSNTLFATERCNSFCLMCSQPPRRVDDNWRVKEMLATIELIDRETEELGISGGEPTLLGEGLLQVVERCRDRLPNTSIHVLTNGKLFRYSTFAEALGNIGHPELMLGIPVYSDIDYQHDYVVQSRGAFDDTFLGLHNLARARVAVEIRVVIHKATCCRLEKLAHFIFRNFPFVSHVAFMGLEKTGFAIANWADLWIDPLDYMPELCRAVAALADRGMAVSIYNHQLCIVPPEFRQFCRRSISDWKAEFLLQCSACSVRDECGGFFVFNIADGVSRGIAAIDA
jgi:His-Xaa-Ser system radical SAM maturase HxsC